MQNDKNELYHYGILGMRWGVRRYQNENGSLTKAGKKRYSQNDDASEDYRKAHSSKSVKSMSNDELRSINNRLQMEQQYSTLTAKKASAGRKFVTGILVTSATTVVTGYATKYMKRGAAYAGKAMAPVAANVGKKAALGAKKAAAAAMVARQVSKYRP